MSGTWAAVDRYITDLLVPSDPALTAALETSAAAGLPPWAVSPRVAATAIQTVGSKGYDGFALALVVADP
jgi:hypothetical protein